MIKTHALCGLLAGLLALAPAFTHADTFGSGPNTFTIDFVTIGNAGNLADPADGNLNGGVQNLGAVSYEYRLGMFEISEDMINKANTLGSLGITKDTRGLNRPATSVSWVEAAKFVNWLNTSSGGTAAYKFDIGGNFQLWDPGDTGYDAANLYRNSLATYWLPTADEWYKAAYYDPVTSGYYLYPTGSNSIPTAVAGGTASGTVVYNNAGSGPADITNAGGLSPYGIMALGGNVWEWEETAADFVNDSTTENVQLRGSGWSFPENFLQNVGGFGNRTRLVEIDTTGFRVASSAVPEPSSALLLAGSGLLLALRRRRAAAAR